MTREYREYAKSRIEYLLKISSFVFDERDKEALEMAIQALSQEPCDDAISRDAVLKRIAQFSTEEGSSVVCQPLYSDVNNMPPVTQKSKTGHWIYNRHKQGVTCSECDAYRKYFGFFEFYCPNCGTRMSDEPCIEKEMHYVTEEEMQKCKEIVKKYAEPQESGGKK